MPEFTLLSFACAVEALRSANRQSGRELYTWRLIGEDAERVASSSGAMLPLDGGLDEMRP